MKPENQPHKFIEPNIHIGNIIERIIMLRKVKKNKLAEILHCSDDTITAICVNQDIEAEVLVKISLFVGYNFFKHYQNDVTQAILSNNYCLFIGDVIDIDMSVIKEKIHIGKMLQQQMEKKGIKLLGLANNFLYKTESTASRFWNKESFDTYYIFNLSIWLKLNFFLYYYEHIENLLSD